MIQRQSGPFKRFTQRFFRWTFSLLVLGVLYGCGSFLIIRGTAHTRAISVESDAAAAPAHAPDSLRLCTYNIAHGRGSGYQEENTAGGNEQEKRERLEAIGLALSKQRLDLVVLNAVDFQAHWSHGMDQAAIIAEAGNFPHIVRQTNYDTGIPFFNRLRFGNVLLSRFPIVEAKRIPFPALSEMERLLGGNHDALLASVQVGKDELLHVLGVHLEDRNEDVRVQCASEIVKLQRNLNESLIVMGNFNSTLPGFPGSLSSANGQNAIELLDSFGNFRRRPMRGRATHRDFTYPTSGPRRIVDWIMPDENWSFMQYGVLQGFLYSDHLPVIAAIRKR